MLKKELTQILCTLLIIGFAVSCDTEDNRCLKSTGEMKTEKFDLEHFSKVCVRSDFDITFETADDYSVTITCGKNLMPYIDHEISGSELILEDNNGCDWLRERIKPKLIVRCPDLREINIYETCDIRTSDTLKFSKLSIQNWAGIFTSNMTVSGDSLYFRCHASTGDYRIEGNSNYAYIYNVGSGFFKGRKFYCKTVHAVHRSLGETEINATQVLMIEDIQLGTLYSFSELCPTIYDNGTDWGDLFVNLGCQ